MSLFFRLALHTILSTSPEGVMIVLTLCHTYDNNRKGGWLVGARCEHVCFWNYYFLPFIGQIGLPFTNILEDHVQEEDEEEKTLAHTLWETIYDKRNDTTKPTLRRNVIHDDQMVRKS